MGKTILFSPIGGTDPIKYLHDGSMLHICRVYKPDVVCLYLSKEMAENHRKDDRYVYSLRKLGELLRHEFDVHVIERNELTEVQQYDVFYEDFRNIIREIAQAMCGEDRLILNMASGTPGMKSALLVLSTLAEYRFLPVQVSTPQGKINSELEDRDNYDVEGNWELNGDNALIQKVDEILQTESVVRNVAAHEIVSVTAEWFKEKAGKSAEDIFANIRFLMVRAGINASDEQWRSYDKMNEQINRLLG